ILGYSELLLTRHSLDDKAREYLREMKRAGERAGGLTRQLLAFGRRQMRAPLVLDLNSVVTETQKLLGRLIGEDIELVTRLEPGKGTGLGLATVYGIVKQSEGFIDVQSEPGRGATFKIHLPRVRHRQAPPASVAEGFRAWRGTETVLLVEDEAGVRQLARLTLEAQGYKVLEAPDGQTALALSEQHAGVIDLLLTDVVMPQMSGRQLRERLAPQRP